MNFQQILDMAIIKAPLPAFERDIMVVVHKLRHPMAAILARVPGDQLAQAVQLAHALSEPRRDDG